MGCVLGRGISPLRGVATAGFLVLGASPAFACDPEIHVVQPGETVFTIAEQYFASVDAWSPLFYANKGKLEDQLEVAEGTELVIPCLESSEIGDLDGAELTFVTGSRYAPFTDRDWPEQGMVTEILEAAMEAAPDPLSFTIAWRDDWATHLSALDDKKFDMGFPWARPNCAALPEHEHCAKFHFSDPIVELLQLLFVLDGSGLTYENESDLTGKTLCRPSGYSRFDLETPDRQWLSNGLVRLEQPASPIACFELLLDGAVDAVALNEFTGWTTLSEMGLKSVVAPLPEPLGVQGLHVIISKSHWRGTTHLYRFNAGLTKLKETSRYDQIVSRHLGVFWDRLN